MADWRKDATSAASCPVVRYTVIWRHMPVSRLKETSNNVLAGLWSVLAGRLQKSQLLCPGDILCVMDS